MKHIKWKKGEFVTEKARNFNTLEKRPFKKITDKMKNLRDKP